MLSEMKFLDSLKEYNKDNCDPALILKIRQNYIDKPEFDPKLIQKVSSACEGLCKWVTWVILVHSCLVDFHFCVEGDRHRQL
jgi:hypothetical protein